MDTPRPRPLRRLARTVTVALAAVAGFLLVAPTIAHAQDAPIVVEDGGGIVLTPIYWTVLTGLAIPLVVALATKAATSTRTKAILAIVLSALAVIIERATLVDGGAKFTSAIFLDALFVYGPQLLSYLGFYQPVLRVNETLAPRFGF